MLCNIVRDFVFREIETQWIIIGKYKKINDLKEGKETKLWYLRGGEREKRRRKGIKGKLVATATTWINIRHTLPLMEDAIYTLVIVSYALVFFYFGSYCTRTYQLSLECHLP